MLDDLVSERLLIPYEPIAAPAAASHEDPAATIWIRHRKVPFVSYSYEWPFSMLKDTALLQLVLLRRALDVGLILKDGSADNVQFVGGRPTFVDLGSFAPYEDGQPWYGYGQFCGTLLNPILLHALTGTAYHHWLRGSRDGIGPRQLRAVLGFRHKLRPSVFTHVVLQDELERRGGDADLLAARKQVPLPKRQLIHFIGRLEKLVRGLKPPNASSAWTSYAEDCHYADEARRGKRKFVDRQVLSRRPGLVWDLGSNTGEYAGLAAEHAGYVVAMDNDAAASESQYVRLRGTRENVLSLVMDVADPSPDQGWAGGERQGLASRGPADLVLALALVHHLRFGANVPLRHFVSWLRTVAKRAIVEFVPRSDPMATRLMRGREDQFGDYDPQHFEAAVAEHFVMTDRYTLPGSQRTLYAMDAR